jgi:hypothetical protein
MNNSKRLLEWVDANGNKVSLNNTNQASGLNNTVDYSEKFNKLLAQIKSTTGVARVIDMKPCSFTAVVGSGYELTVARVIDSTDDRYKATTNDKFRASLYDSSSNSYPINQVFINWNAMLDALLQQQIITNKSVCESVSLSTIDGFKLYENLWEN